MEDDNWPVFVQGPRAVTVIRDVHVFCESSDTEYKLNICAFGESHRSRQCETRAMDVKRLDNGDYVLVEGNDRLTWTIGRLLYVLAVRAKNPVDYFFELEFGREDGDAEAVNLYSLYRLFEGCLGPDKSTCKFLPMVFMHATDYRPLPDTVLLDHRSPDQIRSIVRALLTGNFEFVQHLMPNASFQMGLSMMNPNPRDFRHFDPMLLWQEIPKIMVEYAEQKTDPVTWSLLTETLSALYGNSFAVIDVLKIYLQFSSDSYVRLLVEKRTVLDEFLPRWEGVILTHDFKNGRQHSMAFRIMLALRVYRITCDAVVNGQHRSAKRTGGFIVSRAASQLKKSADCFISANKALPALVFGWLDTVRFSVSSGFVWKQTFEAVGRISPQFFAHVVSDYGYFMDVPSIARLFQRQTTLAVVYEGDLHRARLQNFFEHCSWATSTHFANDRECLRLGGVQAILRVPCEAMECMDAQVCLQCGIVSASLQQCGGTCGDECAIYCGPKCQRTHWETKHRNECQRK
jgi:hypothetical protein